MGHCLPVPFVCECAHVRECARVRAVAHARVCFRSTDLFPHREDSLCLIREERLRVRQGDRRTSRRKN